MTTKTAARPAKKTAATVASVPEEPQTGQTPDQAPITFMGRKILVQAPTAEQIGVWQRTARRFEDADLTHRPGDSPDVLVAKNRKAGKLLDRGIKIIESVLVDEDDRDWLEDQLLDRVMTLGEAANIISLAVDAFGQAEQAPRTGPAPKARRRK